MKITFYHWNTQCPIIHETIQLLNAYEDRIEIEYYDITNNWDLAHDQRIYFPFLTVFDDDKRWFGPLRTEILETYINGEFIEEMPYVIEQGNEVFYGELIELNNESVHLVSNGCSLNNCKISCEKKQQFLSEIGEEFYGYLNVSANKVVGGIEYMPSLNVPYSIPKDENIAFLTCAYHSSTNYDYKTYPLLALEKRLSEKYDKLVAITDESGTFPNGTLEWFLKNGYNDLGLISVEEKYCKLHIVMKELKIRRHDSEDNK